MKITAAVVREHGRFAVEEVDLDDPRAGEVRVKIMACGMCHTDLGVLDGSIRWPLPAILGHEGAGIVDAVGADVRKVAPGDRVVLSFASCGKCPRCQQGDVAYCDAFVALNFGGRRRDGSHTHTAGGSGVSAPFFYQSSFATYALASERNVVKIPDTLPMDIAAPLGCGIQTGAGAVFNRLKAEANQSVVVFGMGAVGLSAVMAAKARGCSPIVAVDLVASRLDLARELGATEMLRGDDPQLSEKLVELSGGGFDLAVEATGVVPVMTAAVAALRATGQAVLLGVPAAAEIPFSARMMKGVTIHTSIEGDSDPDAMIPHLIALHDQGQFPFDRLVQRFSLDTINDAVAAAKDGSAIKPVLVISEE